jgi:peptide/nickel transport system substrate-binding protein
MHRQSLFTHPGGWRGLAAVLAAGMALAGAYPAGSAAARDLVVGSTSITHTLDPMGYNSNNNERVSNNLLESLVEMDDASGEVRPKLAESWTVVDDRTIDFVLRQGVKCHDGTDFDAEDVAFSFGPQRFSDESTPGWKTAKGFFGNIKTIEIQDAHHVRLISDIPDPLMLKRLGTWMSQLICKDAFLAAPSFEEWGKAVVGTGPYKLAEFRPGEAIKLVRFDDYWGEKAPADSVTFKVVPEMAARVSGLLSGELDIVSEMVPDQFKTIEEGGKAYVAGGPVLNIRVLLYDETNPVLADPRVRQALNYAIDRQLIADTIFAGRTTVPHGLQMESFGDMFIGEFQPVTYDPDKARQLLAEAGYKGEPIKYHYRADYYTGEIATAQVLQAMWKEVGLNVEIVLTEDISKVNTKDHIPDRGIFNLSNGAYWNDPLGQIWRLYLPGGLIQGYGSWANPEFDALGADLQSTDPAKRRAAFARMLQIYEYDDPPGTYLTVFPLYYGVRSDVEWKAGMTGYMDLRAGNLKFK